MTNCRVGGERYKGTDYIVRTFVTPIIPKLLEYNANPFMLVYPNRIVLGLSVGASTYFWDFRRVSKHGWVSTFLGDNGSDVLCSTSFSPFQPKTVDLAKKDFMRVFSMMI